MLWLAQTAKFSKTFADFVKLTVNSGTEQIHRLALVSVPLGAKEQPVSDLTCTNFISH